ncbi:hypothetical protein CAEBREN_13038 [Caenorhabditis brenneri]|uniref:Uncharacterized protein n=1 Tax=Caenorhabditis brenneri TaxID=135651 RepID=G0NTJ0_CAEBE|nr:hypothetical protein CAEBREN_13038 [Caenorhabditis brenneri]
MSIKPKNVYIGKEFYVHYDMVNDAEVFIHKYNSFLGNSEGTIRSIIIILYTALVIIMFANLKSIMKKRKMMKSTDAQKSDNTTLLITMVRPTVTVELEDEKRKKAKRSWIN